MVSFGPGRRRLLTGLVLLGISMPGVELNEGAPALDELSIGSGLTTTIGGFVDSPEFLRSEPLDVTEFEELEREFDVEWVDRLPGIGRGLPGDLVGVLGDEATGVEAFEFPRFRLPTERRPGLERGSAGSSSPAHVPSTHPLVPGFSSSIGAASVASTPSVCVLCRVARLLPQ